MNTNRSGTSEKMSLPLLSMLVWLPIAGGVAVLLLGSAERAQLGKQVALGDVDRDVHPEHPALYRVRHHDGQYAVRRECAVDSAVQRVLRLGVDGISMPLIMLTTFLTPLVVIAGWEVIKLRPAQYFASFLMLEGHDDRRLRGHSTRCCSTSSGKPCSCRCSSSSASGAASDASTPRSSSSSIRSWAPCSCSWR